MRIGRGALSGLALLLAASGSAAAAPEPFHGAQPVIAVRLDVETTTAARTLDIFRLPAPDRSFRFVVRGVDLTGDRPTRTRWADSASCPALPPRLRALEAVQMHFVAPASALEGRYVTLDGTYVSVRAAAEPGGPHPWGEMTVAGNDGPWVDWAEALERDLRPCWTGTEPAVATGG